jgi:hypothetical protein
MRNAAREVMGLVQYKAGQLQEAMASFQAIVDDPPAAQDVRQRIQIYQIQLVAEGAEPIVASSEAAPDVSVSAPADVSSTVAVSSEASMAVDASTELDVTPPVDASAVSSAEVSSAASSAEPSSAPSSAMEISSSAP